MVNVTTRRRRASWIVLLSLTLVVLAFAFAACGSDSGSSSSSSGSASTSASTTSSSSSSSSGSAAQMVNIKETKGSKGDVYTCDPTSITIKKGDSVSFTNMSDEKQDFDQGDAQKAGVDFVLDLNGSKTVPFNTAGTFMLKSEKGATITVTVQ